MPQLDPYILFHQIMALFFVFFLIYAYVRRNILPKLNEILKYRNKKIKQLYGHDRGNRNLFNQSRFYYTWMGENYLNMVNGKLTLLLNKYLEKKNLIQYKRLVLQKLGVLPYENMNFKSHSGDNVYKSLKKRHSTYYLNN